MSKKDKHIEDEYDYEAEGNYYHAEQRPVYSLEAYQTALDRAIDSRYGIRVEDDLILKHLPDDDDCCPYLFMMWEISVVAWWDDDPTLPLSLHTRLLGADFHQSEVRRELHDKGQVTLGFNRKEACQRMYDGRGYMLVTTEEGQKYLSEYPIAGGID